MVVSRAPTVYPRQWGKRRVKPKWPVVERGAFRQANPGPIEENPLCVDGTSSFLNTLSPLYVTKMEEKLAEDRGATGG